MEAWDAHECIKFQWLVLQPSNHYLSFKIDLLKEKFAVQKLGENFLALIKISHLVFISKAFFQTWAFSPKNIWNEGYESK